MNSDFQKSDKSHFDDFKIFSALDSHFYALHAGAIAIPQPAFKAM